MVWRHGSFAARRPHASQFGSLQAKKSGATVQDFLSGIAFGQTADIRVKEKSLGD
jgi:hypothetical protein